MGLGGDELFAPLPTIAWSLAHQAPLRAPRLAIAYCRNNRIPLRRGIPSIASKVRYGRWVSRSMRELASKGSTPNDDLSWSGGFSFPSYMLNEAKELVRAPFDVGRLEPLNEDRTVNQALESLLGQAAIIRQVNDMFGRGGITWTSIFVDPGVIGAALALPLKTRLHPYINKPSLYRAMRGLMPREIFARATKGEYTKDSYKTFFARRESLVDELAHGYVGQLGLIDRSALKARLSMRAVSSEFLFELKRLVAAERWIRSVR
jgi:asparagine synthase